MNNPQNLQPSDSRSAVRVSLSLFPGHDAIVRQFADETHRTYSNAVQFIIEDWAKQKRAAIASARHDPAAGYDPAEYED